ncbi:hypothetical protein SAMN05192534_109111 [Alteribacillus persepolensis]|uniref:Uncharacterized protein n=1 Tax=Alteribacillus persepolensis TaxID=568899 RepID=A0A1G8EI97_9BACI|nr:hypothetical protein [Alteribacillus persepolensis]SDH69653.1 hypothetical protein SAMN05192534_109111 [Alteribacillus persepolensis]
MNSILRGNGWERFIEKGIGTIIHSLISGQKVCLVEADTDLGERILEKIRDELLIDLRNGTITDAEFEDCLSLLYLHQGSKVPHSFSNHLIINLSFTWTVEKE